MAKTFDDGIVLAKELFNTLDARGKKWKNRNVPVYVRENLWIPFYITEIGGEEKLFTIRLPNPHNPKVHFREYS